MKNLQNESGTDRVVRLFAFVGAALAGYYTRGNIQKVWIAVAAIALISGLSGFSLFYKLVGVNTLKRRKGGS